MSRRRGHVGHQVERRERHEQKSCNQTESHNTYPFGSDEAARSNNSLARRESAEHYKRKVRALEHLLTIG